MKKQLACLITALALVLTACTPAVVETPTATPMAELPTPSPTELATPTPIPTETEGPSPELALAMEYLTQERYGERAYSAADAPQEPQEGDLRVDSFTYLGECPIYETVGVAYQLDYSRYLVRYDETGEKTITWTLMDDPIYLVLERSGYDDSWQGVKGNAYYWDEEEPIEDLILRVAWGLMDLEVSLTAEGYPQLVGIGSEANFPFLSGEPTVTVLEGWDPIHNEGDHWLTYEYEGFTALCYHSATEDRTIINRIETNRTDLSTYRGVQVGDSREEVTAAYPNLSDAPYWDYQGDYLWYCSDGENEMSVDYGPVLLFWFESDRVVKFQLLSMFD